MDEVIDILLVDDEPRNLDALEAILADPGYRLLRAGDADSALRLLLDHDVAAIVLDIKMPGVSGFELARMIKGTKRFRQIPIVFLTAYLLGDADVLAGYGAGAVDYLTKPVNPQILRHKVEVFAELFRKTRALAVLNDTLEARVQERTARLEQSEAALRRASEQKDQFLATLAHELRNPLAPLRTGLDLLLELPPPTASAARAMGAMDRQLHYMVRLIDDLLDMSRITRGVLELRRQPTELGGILEQAIETTRPSLDQRHQKVVVRRNDPCIAEVDPTRICQIVANLLHNASKYSPKDAEIVVELERRGDQAFVRVADHGVGIPRDQLGRVFDMFARIERPLPNANGGLGIGLALARRLAELHGGALAVDSEGEGRGATFTLTIRGARPVESDAPAPINGATNGGGPQLDIVVIEDNPDAAETLVMWLEHLGHRVKLATTGPDGVALVRRTCPDVVFCDLGLPGMDGVEVCRQVRTTCQESHPRMVALTGWGMDEDRRRTGEAGFDDHLVKPVAADRLYDILSACHPR